MSSTLQPDIIVELDDDDDQKADNFDNISCKVSKNSVHNAYDLNAGVISATSGSGTTSSSVGLQVSSLMAQVAADTSYQQLQLSGHLTAIPSPLSQQSGQANQQMAMTLQHLPVSQATQPILQSSGLLVHTSPCAPLSIGCSNPSSASAEGVALANSPPPSSQASSTTTGMAGHLLPGLSLAQALTSTASSRTRTPRKQKRPVGLTRQQQQLQIQRQSANLMPVLLVSEPNDQLSQSALSPQATHSSTSPVLISSPLVNISGYPGQLIISPGQQHQHLMQQQQQQQHLAQSACTETISSASGQQQRIHFTVACTNATSSDAAISVANSACTTHSVERPLSALPNEVLQV
ncbi:unnamed protein product [Protopolystoma xenopodis]|uniref:Uncharacterized protein n=1 Tax=Protopolystoma xenopodis TaxID=117903 RepID=A0A448XK82_9PLAT|nr:unnamed protein product [Protopolystoma xenopodis]